MMPLMTVTKFMGITAPHLVMTVAWPTTLSLMSNLPLPDPVVRYSSIAGRIAYFVSQLFPFARYSITFGRAVYIISKCYPIIALSRQTRNAEPKSKYSKRITTGLIFSALGDFFLAQNSDLFFTPGLASFLIAHLFYIGAYESRTPSLRLNMGASIFAVSGLLAQTVLLPSVPGILKPAVVVYVTALVGMLWRATARYLDVREEVREGKVVGEEKRDVTGEEEKAAMGLVGAGFFVVSDFLLAFNKFVTPVPFHQPLVMVTYYAAQYGIAMSV